MRKCFLPWRAGLAGLACFGLLALAQPIIAAEPGLLEKRESLYNNIFIFGDTDTVSMTFGQNKRYYTESSMKLSDPGALTVEYTRYMTLGWPIRRRSSGSPKSASAAGARCPI